MNRGEEIDRSASTKNQETGCEPIASISFSVPSASAYPSLLQAKKSRESSSPQVRPERHIASWLVWPSRRWFSWWVPEPVFSVARSRRDRVLARCLTPAWVQDGETVFARGFSQEGLSLESRPRQCKQTSDVCAERALCVRCRGGSLDA